MPETRLYEFPSSAGGEWDERLFEEQTKCEECEEWFRSDEVNYNDDLDKHVCEKCETKLVNN